MGYHLYTFIESDRERLDAEPINEFVAEQYRKAGIKKQDIQMGAVIITGETARKANANKVLGRIKRVCWGFCRRNGRPRPRKALLLEKEQEPKRFRRANENQSLIWISVVERPI